MNRVKELRKKIKYTQGKLAEHLNVHQTAISQWETGRTSPDKDVAAKIARLCNVSLDYVLGLDLEQTAPHFNEKSFQARGVRIPVCGYVAAGIPSEAIESFESDNPDDWEEIDEQTAKSGRHIGLRIKGDSMEPKMSEGDIIIVRLQPDINSGDIAVVRVNGDEATCKKIKKTPEGIMLISLNQAYEPMFYSNKQIKELPLTILGRVVELRAKF